MEIQKHKNDQQLTDKDLIKYLENLGMLQKLTTGEKDTFLQISKAFGLNPFKREIYASKYGENFSIVVGFEVYLKRAERSGLLDGWDITSTGSVEGKDLKAIITIYRKDRTRAFVHEVFYTEYVQYTKDRVPNKFWREKPITMIKKVAMGQGFRLCFSDELGGMPYTAEEITDEATFEVINQQPAQQQPQFEVIATVEPTVSNNEALHLSTIVAITDTDT
jgi:phage recombination protein Bet